MEFLKPGGSRRPLDRSTYRLSCRAEWSPWPDYRRDSQSHARAPQWHTARTIAQY